MRKSVLILLVMVVFIAGCGGAKEEPKAEKKSYPVPKVKPSALEGKRTYVTNCLKCHGVKGDGLGELARNMDPPPADFRRNAVISIKPFEYFNVVTSGRENTAMQPYKEVLTFNARWDLVFYLWTFRTDDVEIDEGKIVYEELCVRCHGEAGDGQGAEAPEHDPPPTDFADRELMAGISDEELGTAINDGIINTSMRSFSGEVDEVELKAVIAYLRKFDYIF